MGQTKIDWCDMVLNPAWGCGFNCKFCYARKMARRWAKIVAQAEFRYRIRRDSKLADYLKQNEKEKWYLKTLERALKNFEPVTVLLHNLEKSLPQKEKIIFVNSMSEVAFWPGDGWLHCMMVEKARKYPQHKFLFLSKAPECYTRFFSFDLPANMWFGATALNELQLVKHQKKLKKLRELGLNTFICLEPMVVKIDPQLIDPEATQWIIIGAQTNPYRFPERKWVEQVVRGVKKKNIPVFLKDNLFKAFPQLEKLKEFPFKSD